MYSSDALADPRLSVLTRRPANELRGQVPGWSAGPLESQAALMTHRRQFVQIRGSHRLAGFCNRVVFWFDFVKGLDNVNPFHTGVAPALSLPVEAEYWRGNLVHMKSAKADLPHIRFIW